MLHTSRTRVGLPVLVAAIAVLSLSACTNDTTSDAAPSAVAGSGVDAAADALWEHRTAYVGDNSKVIALTSDAGFGPAGAYQLKLHTDKAPYAVEIAFTQPSDDSQAVPADPATLEPAATKLLGTVANLDQVIVTQPGQTTFTLTAGQASSKLGYDVKILGRDHTRLTEYVTQNH